MQRALITGITGQDGSYLSEHLLAKGYEVYGLIRGQNNPKRQHIERTWPDVKIVEGDLLDQASLMNAIQKVKPDEVYNLAAISFVALSWNQPELTGEITGLGALRMLEAIRLTTGASRIAREVGGGHQVLPGVEQRDVRQGARDAAERADAVPPAQPVRRREGVRALHHGELPRELQHLRLQRHPLQPRIAAARAGVRHAEDHDRRRRASSSACRRSC